MRATIVDAATAFALSQVLGVAAQRAIANMRMSMQRHITRLPTSYFDSTQTGVLISRVMNDAEGIRNLVGSGLVQLVGGLVTAVIALASCSISTGSSRSSASSCSRCLPAG